MSETNTDRIRRGYAAFSKGDLSTLAELIAPECQWVVGGDNRLTGTCDGRDATFAYFAALLDATEGTFQVALQDAVEIAPDTVLVTAAVTATARGASYAEQVIQQHRMRHGQIVECRTFVENGHLWDRLIGSKQITLPTQGARESITTA